MLFGLFSRDKRDHNDVWMIKITIKTKEIDLDACLFEKNVAYETMFVPKIWLFPISLLVCEFKSYRQTWYQKGDVRSNHYLNNFHKSGSIPC